jgi:glycosyltransferase involved in cell wall biosynthesis
MKLTIGIPTFNGAKTINQTIEGIINQTPQNCPNEIDILISDNCSTDDTASIVEKYKGCKNIDIKYIKNSENIGYDRNINQLFKHATGDYVWILADDDVPTDGAIDGILKSINQTSSDIIILNFDAYDRNLEKIQHSLELPDQIHCTNPSDFFKNAHGRYGQVSSLIIKKDKWNSIDISDAIGSNYIHIYVVYRIMKNGSADILGKPFIKVRLGSENFGTTGDALLNIATSGVKLIHLMKAMGYEKNITDNLLEKSKRYVLDTVKISKRTGIQYKKIAVTNLLQAYNSPKIWLRYIPLIYMPDFLYKIHSRKTKDEK